MPPHRTRQPLGRLFWFAGLAVGIAGGALVAISLAGAAPARQEAQRQPNASAMM